MGSTSERAWSCYAGPTLFAHRSVLAGWDTFTPSRWYTFGLSFAEEELPAFPLCPGDAPKHLLVLGIGVELAPRPEEVDHEIKAVLEGYVSHIALDPGDLNPSLDRLPTGHV